MTIIYDYRSASGRLLYRVLRSGHGRGKQFRITDASGRALGAVPDPGVLYRLPEIARAPQSEIVVVCEGEKDAERVASLGWVATTNPGGCHHGWRDEYTSTLAGREIVILADNDRPGVRHAERVEQALIGAASAVAILRLPRLRRAEDVSDWLDLRGGTPAELETRIRRALGTRAAPPAPAGGHKRRHAIFESRLSSTERLVLLAIQHNSGTHSAVTAGELARMTGLHRVSVQRVIGALVGAGILARDGGRLVVVWERLA